MWKWDQSSGTLTRETSEGVKEISRGYSGFEKGKNNPSLQEVKSIGPIPQGKWNITDVYDSKNVGPFALKLEPIHVPNLNGRSQFRIHGDSIKNPGRASHGCIILPRIVREQIWESGDRDLIVEE